MSDFKAILTDLGQQLITAAYQAGDVVTVTQMAFGDANQQPVTVDPAMTALINQTDILPLTRGPQAEDIIGGGIDILSSDYPDSWVYECGLFDDDGNLIVYASYPPTLVPEELDNVKKGVSIDIGLIMSSTDGITVYVDPELEALTRAVADTLYLRQDKQLGEIEAQGAEGQQAARNNLGLKSAATHDITTSPSDTTVGNVLQVGDGGLLSSDGLVMGLVSQFLGYANADAEEVPANGAGWQSAYATSRRAQLFLDTVGHVWSRFSLSTDALDIDTPWALHFTTLNKPTADDVEALPIIGGTLTGPLTILDDAAAILIKADTLGAAAYISIQDADGSNVAYVGKGSINVNDVAFSNYKGSSNAIILKADGSVAIICANSKNLNVTGEVIPSNYGNFDARYISNLQLGAQVAVARNDDTGENKAAVGYVVTGSYSSYQDSNWEMDKLYCKPLQKYINGAWVTISG